jgi:hypothetical protein
VCGNNPWQMDSFRGVTIDWRPSWQNCKYGWFDVKCYVGFMSGYSRWLIMMKFNIGHSAQKCILCFTEWHMRWSCLFRITECGSYKCVVYRVWRCGSLVISPISHMGHSYTSTIAHNSIVVIIGVLSSNLCSKLWSMRFSAVGRIMDQSGPDDILVSVSFKFCYLWSVSMAKKGEWQ